MSGLFRRLSSRRSAGLEGNEPHTAAEPGATDAPADTPADQSGHRSLLTDPAAGEPHTQTTKILSDDSPAPSHDEPAGASHASEAGAAPREPDAAAPSQPGAAASHEPAAQAATASPSEQPGVGAPTPSTAQGGAVTPVSEPAAFRQGEPDAAARPGPAP